MYVSLHLKCPEQGEWVALTAVDADGRRQPLGYVPREWLTDADEMADHLRRMEGQGWIDPMEL